MTIQRFITLEEAIAATWPLEPPRFCTHCGADIVARFVGAERYVEYSGYEGEQEFRPSKYNGQTGKRQYVVYAACPKFGWKHDRKIGSVVLELET